MENIKTKNVLIAVTILLLVVVLAVSLGSKTGYKEAVKIGVVLPLTGPAADYGLSVKNGIDLAVIKVQKDYGLDLRVIYEDSQMDSKLAVSAIKKLTDVDGVKYVVGFSSGETLAMCPITDAKGVILISSASSPAVTSKCGDYTFRNAPADTYQGKVLADKVTEKKYKKVAIFYINNDYGVGLKDEFLKDYKGTIVDIESHKPGDTDFRTQLIKIKSSKPEAVILISQMAEGTVFFKQRMDLKFDQPVFASEALKDPNLLKLDATLLQDLFISFISQYDGKEFNEYKDNYMNKYGSDFGAFSDYEYDNVLTLASAIHKCADIHDSDCVKNEVYKTNMIGATGLINFDSNGDRVNKSYTLYQVENGGFVSAE